MKHPFFVRRFFIVILTAAFFVPTLMAQAPPSPLFSLPQAAPETLRFDPRLTEWIDAVGNRMIAENETSGCVIAVGRHDGIAYLKAFGDRQVEPERLPMETDSIFDLASITKCAATATALAVLYDEGKFDLDDPIAKYLPDFAQNGKENVTIRQCLTHLSGIKPVWILNYHADSEEEIWAKMAAEPLVSQPGESFRYICQNFLILGHLVEALSGERLKDFTAERLYRPLGMADTGFCPKEENESLKASKADESEGNVDQTTAELKAESKTESRFERCVTTEFDKERGWIKGVVHDPQSWVLGGNAGNAGLFSTAGDLAVFAAMLLGKGTLHKPDGTAVKIFSEKTFETFTKAYPIPDGVRGLGWDKRRNSGVYSRAWNYSPAAFGHTGFTGTVFWVDPANDLFVILLGNRLHPKKRDNKMNTRGAEIGTIAVDALRDPIDTEAVRADAMKKVKRIPGTGGWRNEVLNGIDILMEDEFRLLAGKRVGLITNQTGVDQNGNPTALLLKSGGVDLRALFSPEHGIAGRLEQSEIGDTRDPVSGIPVISLYGESRRPNPPALADIDTLVFDIQDVGARFYTYISTMGMAMQSAADLGKSFVVLDRVNPIGGESVAGPLPDPGEESFVAFDLLPVRHGMTVGEIALLLNARQKMNLDLTVIPVAHWKRSFYYDETNLPWINPSPNMRSLAAAILYPGVCLAEGTGYSVGRGTETPFEIIGAEWIDGPALARTMNGLVAPDGKPTPEKPLSGIRFEAIEFTPTAKPFQNQTISGLRFIVTDRTAFEPVRMGIALMRELYSAYPEKLSDRGANHLLMNQTILRMIKTGASLDEMEAAWKEDFDRFLESRRLWMIYD